MSSTTAYAQLRATLGLTQQRTADLIGYSLRGYQRLEEGARDSPGAWQQLSLLVWLHEEHPLVYRDYLRHLDES